MNWNKCIALLSSLLLLFAIEAHACAPFSSVGRTTAHYSLFKADKFYSNYLKWDSIHNAFDNRSTHGGLYINFMGLQGSSHYDIVYDWTRYLNNPNIHTEGIAELMIPLKLKHWQRIDSIVGGKAPMQPHSLIDSAIFANNFFKLLKTQGRTDITRLMVFLKRVEQIWELDYQDLYDLRSHGYYSTKDVYEKNRNISWLLLQEGKKLYKEETDRFLKMRYAHQLVRLASFAGENGEAIALFKSTFEDLPGNHAIEQWMIMQYAGILSREGNQALANYYYLTVMASDSEKGEIAYTSMRVRNRQEWEETMAYCKTAEEKSWLGYSFYQFNKGVNAAQRADILASILKENPESDYGKLVAVQLINQLETELLPLREFVINSNDYWLRGEDDEEIKKRSFNVPKTLAQLHKSLAASIPKASTTRAFWQLVNGYLYFLEGNYAAAQPWLKLALAQDADAPTKAYAQLFITYIDIAMLSFVDAKTEARLLPHLQWIEAFHKQAADYAYRLLAEKYRKQGDVTKALMVTCKDICHDLLPERIDLTLPFTQILALCRKEDKTPYEEWLILGHTAVNATEQQLQEYHLMWLLSQYKFKEAAAYSCTFKSPYGNQYGFPDPFILYPTNGLYEMSRWGGYHANSKHYNRHTFAWEMSATLDSIKLDPKNKAKYYLKLAKGMAHMQRNGGAWLTTTFYKVSGDSWFYQPDKSKSYKFNPQVIGTFKKAYNSTNDREIQAEAIYGMIWYYNTVYDVMYPERYKKNNDNRVKPLLEQLYNNYADTKYYQEIINQCEYIAKDV